MSLEQSNEIHTAAEYESQGVVKQPGWLWVSAGILAALIVVQGGGLFESKAYAEMSTTSGSYSMMTTDGGNDEILVVVDSRQESLMVYRSMNGTTLEMLEKEELSSLFSRARARAVGSP
jgi:hypothetical protein